MRKFISSTWDCRWDYIKFFFTVTTLVLILVSSSAASHSHLYDVHYPTGSGNSMAVRDGYVYLLNAWTRGDSILVFDATNPDDPRFAAGLPGRGYARSGAFHDNVFYIPAINWGVMTVDISDPAEPLMLRNLFLNFPRGDVSGLHLTGGRLYVTGPGGLRIFDLSEPDAPMPVAYYPDTPYANLVVAEGDRLIFRPRGSDAVLAVIDEEHRIIEYSRRSLPGNLHMIDNTLYQFAGGELIVHDLSDMREPSVAARVEDIRAGAGMKGPDRMLLRGSEDTLELYDVSTPQQPEKIRKVTFPENFTASRMTASEGMLYAVDDVRGALGIFDLSGDVARLRGERFFMFQNSGSLIVGDDNFFLYYASGQFTVLTLLKEHNGTADFSSYHAEGQTPAMGIRRGAAIERHGDFLLTGDGLLNISDAQNPEAVHPMRERAESISIRDDLAALALDDRIVFRDVSRLPEFPLLGEYRVEGADFQDVLLPEDGMAYVVNRSDGETFIETLDIANPESVRLLGRCEVPDAVTAVKRDDIIYLPSTGNAGLTLVDVSTPAEPRLVKTLDDFVSVGVDSRIHLAGERIYYGDLMQGIRVVDISDPTDPVLIETLVGSTDYSAVYTDIRILGDKLYGLRYSHLDVWEIPEP